MHISNSSQILAVYQQLNTKFRLEKEEGKISAKDLYRLFQDTLFTVQSKEEELDAFLISENDITTATKIQHQVDALIESTKKIYEKFQNSSSGFLSFFRNGNSEEIDQIKIQLERSLSCQQLRLLQKHKEHSDNFVKGKEEKSLEATTQALLNGETQTAYGEPDLTLEIQDFSVKVHRKVIMGNCSILGKLGEDEDSKSLRIPNEKKTDATPEAALILISGFYTGRFDAPLNRLFDLLDTAEYLKIKQRKPLYSAVLKTIFDAKLSRHPDFKNSIIQKIALKFGDKLLDHCRGEFLIDPDYWANLVSGCPELFQFCSDQKYGKCLNSFGEYYFDEGKKDPLGNDEGKKDPFSKDEDKKNPFGKTDQMALDLFKRASEHGSRRSEAYLAYHYLQGWGVKKDQKKCHDHLEKAGMDAKALRIRGEICTQFGFNFDQNEAFKYFKASYEMDGNDPWTLYNLADCYYFGIGTPHNIKRAFELYEFAQFKCYALSQIYPDKMGAYLLEKEIGNLVKSFTSTL